MFMISMSAAAFLAASPAAQLHAGTSGGMGDELVARAASPQFLDPENRSFVNHALLVRTGRVTIPIRREPEVGAVRIIASRGIADLDYFPALRLDPGLLPLRSPLGGKAKPPYRYQDTGHVSRHVIDSRYQAEGVDIVPEKVSFRDRNEYFGALMAVEPNRRHDAAEPAIQLADRVKAFARYDVLAPGSIDPAITEFPEQREFGAGLVWQPQRALKIRTMGTNRRVDGEEDQFLAQLSATLSF